MNLKIILSIIFSKLILYIMSEQILNQISDNYKTPLDFDTLFYTFYQIISDEIEDIIFVFTVCFGNLNHFNKLMDTYSDKDIEFC